MKHLHLILIFFHSLSVIGQVTKQEISSFDIKSLTKLIKKDTNNAEAYWRRGYQYADLKKYDLALKDVNKSLQIDSNFSYGQVIEDRGLIYQGMNQDSNAILDFTNAISFILTDSLKFYHGIERNYYYRAQVELKLKDTTSSLIDLDSAVIYWNQYFWPRLLRAQINTIRENYQLAMEDYNFLTDYYGPANFPENDEFAESFYYFRSIAKKYTGDKSYIKDEEIATKFKHLQK